MSDPRNIESNRAADASPASTVPHPACLSDVGPSIDVVDEKMRQPGTTARRERLRRAMKPVLSLSRPRTKAISAMMRVRNEEEYLLPSVLSIIDIVDEVVIVDNLSDDQTPMIIKYLSRRYPTKVRRYSYPYRVARPGSENSALAATPAGKRSPALLANFYNWCLCRCTHAYALKWDGDMVAGPDLERALRIFRQSRDQVVCLSGGNVHPSFGCYIADDATYSSIDHYEPRLFARRFARYADYGGACETLYSPYRGAEWSSVYEPLTYVHLKYCKREPVANNSCGEQPPVRPGRALDAELTAVTRSANTASRIWLAGGWNSLSGDVAVDLAESRSCDG